MAGDWIKMRTALGQDPAVLLIAERLKLDVFSVVGRLHAVWSWATDHLSDGHASVTLMSHVDHVAGVRGFAEAMRAEGWLTVNGDQMQFPKWERHLSQGAKQRALATQRKRVQRASNVTEMSRGERDENVTREEKRRVEQQQQGGAAAAAPSSPPPDVPAPPALVSQGVSQRTAKQLAQAYPAETLDAVAARMRAIAAEEAIENPDGLARSLAQNGVSPPQPSRKATVETLKVSFERERAPPPEETFEEMKARLEAAKAAGSQVKTVDFTVAGSKASKPPQQTKAECELATK